MSNEFTNTGKAGRIMRLLGWINIVLTIFLAIAIGVPAVMSGEPAEGFWAIVFVVGLMFAISALYLWVGTALKRHEGWARIVTLILALISLLNVPIGTVIGIVIMVYLFRGWNEEAAVA